MKTTDVDEKFLLLVREVCKELGVENQPMGGGRGEGRDNDFPADIQGASYDLTCNDNDNVLLFYAQAAHKFNQKTKEVIGDVSIHVRIAKRQRTNEVTQAFAKAASSNKYASINKHIRCD